MSREWEPGEIVVGLLDGNEIVGIVRGGGKRMFYADSVTTDQVDLKHVRNLRRLAVIDPEDREQVDELCKALVVSMHKAGDVASAANGVHPATVTAALREFANPTPPKCPSVLHLGAERVECERDPGHSMTDHRNDSLGQGIRWSQ